MINPFSYIAKKITDFIQPVEPEKIDTEEFNGAYVMAAPNRWDRLNSEPLSYREYYTAAQVVEGIRLEAATAELQRDVTANITVGAINNGTTLLKGTDFTTFVEKLLIKAFDSTISFANAPRNVAEVGDTLHVENITVNVNRGTGNPTRLLTTLNQTSVTTEPVENSNLITLNTDVTTNSVIRSTLTYLLGEETKTTSINFAINFLHRSAFGNTKLSVVDFDAAAAKSLLDSQQNLNSNKNQRHTYNLQNDRAVYAYPAELGMLTSIKDVNNFEYIDSFTRKQLSVNVANKYTINYNVYILNDPVTVNTTFTFS